MHKAIVFSQTRDLLEQFTGGRTLTECDGDLSPEYVLCPR
jgi:hypothetical protein